jgi:rod shape determining protein RodA
VAQRIDAWLLLAIAGIIGASLATLHAVVPVLGWQPMLRQLVWGAAGVVLVWVLAHIRPSRYATYASMFYVICLVALIAVLFVGDIRGGARAWFALGPITIQPSEFARLGTILLLAAWLGRRRTNTLGPRDSVIVLAIVGSTTLLVALEPDLGVAITYLPIGVAGLWLGGLPTRVWMVLVLLAVMAAGVVWSTGLKPYQKERVLTLVNPERDPYGYGYQLQQSKIAVGSGGWVGQGLGRGSQSLLRFLPAQHTDFVFAVWAEATGFLGATVLLLAYALLLFRIAVTAFAAETRYGLVVSVLVGAWLGFQVIFNVGMVVGWLPTAGITLPLFSYGGSSLLTTCIALSFVHSVWYHRLVYQ